MPKNKNENVIEIANLVKKFGRDKVIDGLDLEVKRGEVFGFLGPNGAGKTTTIRIILNVLHPTEGTVKVFGFSSKKTKKIHKRIGYLAGDMEYEEDLTGKKYLNFVNHIYGGGHKDRVKDLADLFEIDLKDKIRNYSRGNKQKIGLIAAIMHKPELLIFDEPTSGFDPIMQTAFSKMVLDFKKRGGTVLMSSHVLSEVQQLCDRVAFIKDGSIVGVQNLDDSKDKLTKRVVVSSDSASTKQIELKAKTLSNLNLLKKSKGKLIYSYNGDVKKLLKFFAAQNITDIMIEEPDLEEVFLHYYNNNSERYND